MNHFLTSYFNYHYGVDNRRKYAKCRKYLLCFKTSCGYGYVMAKCNIFNIPDKVSVYQSINQSGLKDNY